MSFLKLRTMRRLPSARKAWKFFTTTLQKLNTSKTIKKPPKTAKLKLKLNKNTSKKVSWPTFFIKTRRKNKKARFKSSQKLFDHHHRHCLLKRPSSPVFIDQLFLEPSTEGEKRVQLSSSEKKRDLVDDQGSSSMQAETSNGRADTADDMWESLVLASPQMHGINERAEEFIARFRADMKNQEMLARR